MFSTKKLCKKTRKRNQNSKIVLVCVCELKEEELKNKMWREIFFFEKKTKETFKKKLQIIQNLVFKCVVQWIK